MPSSTDLLAIPSTVREWSDSWLSRLGVSVPDILGARAQLTGIAPQGRVSASGSCRIVEAADSFWALSIARDDDRDLLPALVGDERAIDWPDVEAWSRNRSAEDCAAWACTLGLAAAVVAQPQKARPRTMTWHRGDVSGAVVLDLSAMWAGPLAGQLLRQAGARVIKVESTSRPDGSRRGNPDFFALLNNGKQQIGVDVHTPDGIAQLLGLIEQADVVIESSRPRALLQLGIDATALAGPGLTWVSITAYGRDDPHHRIGYGDDVAVGAGAASWDDDGPSFAGDALADPITGIAAARAALHGIAAGGGLFDVSMHDAMTEALHGC